MGKTTLASQMPNSLLIAFERGYNALPGVIAQDVTTWGEMKQVLRELKKNEVKSTFDAVIIDTIDIAADQCTKYICQQKGIDSLGDLGYGKGWTAFKDEFNDVFRSLTQLGYAVFFIGHHKEILVGPEGNQRVQIRPAMSNSVRQIIEGMADIYGYAHQDSAHKMSVLTLRCADDTIACGSRFKYLPSEIETSYTNLVNALHDAIEKEASEHNNEFVTEEKTVYVEKPQLNYDALMAEFNSCVGQLMERDSSTNGPKIVQIVEKYLGKGSKISETTPDQVEMVNLIVIEIKEDLLSKK